MKSHLSVARKPVKTKHRRLELSAHERYDSHRRLDANMGRSRDLGEWILRIVGGSRLHHRERLQRDLVALQRAREFWHWRRRMHWGSGRCARMGRKQNERATAPWIHLTIVGNILLRGTEPFIVETDP